MATGWFRLSDDRICFARITRDPFEDWLRDGEGAALVAAARTRTKFSLLGRDRAARRALWRATESAFTAEPTRQAVQREADRYLALLASLAYTEALPQVHVDLHRLVAVPRALVDHGIFTSLLARFDEDAGLEELDRSVRIFMAGRLVVEMDAALAGARPSVKRPVAAREQWASVGLNAEIAWTLPVSGGGAPERRGHFHLYEVPRTGMARPARRRIAAAVRSLDEAIAGLSRAERLNIVGRIASAGLPL